MVVYANKEALIRDRIRSEDAVLDLGFWGQGTNPDSPRWIHNVLRSRAREVWGIDLEYDESRLPGDAKQYARASAEAFSIDASFDIIFAGDIIEHLSNLGSFLDSSRKHLKPGGRLIITTPSAFNLFNLAEKFSKDEPTVNADHTCYFNKKTIARLLAKNGWKADEFAFVYSLELPHQESWKKKFLNALYCLFSWFTPKFLETLVVIAVPAA